MLNVAVLLDHSSRNSEVWSCEEVSHCRIKMCTPMKSNIDTQNSHVWKEIITFTKPSFLVSILDFGGVVSYMFHCQSFVMFSCSSHFLLQMISPQWSLQKSWSNPTVVVVFREALGKTYVMAGMVGIADYEVWTSLETSVWCFTFLVPLWPITGTPHVLMMYRYQWRFSTNTIFVQLCNYNAYIYIYVTQALM